MNISESEYALEPSAFYSMRDAQVLVDALEANLQDRALGAANIRPELVEMVSELTNNAAEHGLSENGAHAHVRYLPHRRGHAFDAVVSDTGPGIRATLSANTGIPQPDTDAEAIEMAIRELVSGTDNPTRGIGLWQIFTAMRKPGRKLIIQSGSGLLILYGDGEPELRVTEHRQGTMVRLTVPT